MRHKFFAFATSLLVCLASARAQINEGETVADAAVPANTAMTPIKDVPGLPRVLLVGDSISIAYTLPVRELLKGKANVHRIPVNAGSSLGPARIKVWLGSEKWDVVHFNFGIHDARLNDGKPAVDLATYEQNLRTMVAILKTSGAKIVYATTTPIPPVTHPESRSFAPIPPYNEVALKVMKENNIPVDDLCTLMLPVEQKYQVPFDVHFSAQGSQLMAAAVSKSIEAQLPPAKAQPN